MAIAQAFSGALRVIAHSIPPASAGAEPSATIVPTATPVSATAAKNASWYVATVAAAIRTGQRGSRASACGPRAISATATSSAPPIRIRPAPTPVGARPSGPSA